MIVHSRYLSRGTSSSKPLIEHIFFNVTDSGDNMLPYQSFMVHIIPDKYKGPLVRPADDVAVCRRVLKLSS